ncbi:predicted protein [Plenodomus lingam JN3]|uniref:Predicted protein n=1 Tax=Leptosphaeria maculans (strain JN3 / isolate v23.1.3 / race Av1-4-5-6-7-8) TaxID=985895 RepID=E5A5M6_LEPMJ|nr:predicted protein [Plenodomus lingam JN3]CBX98924.1 predicted protein [Plenodomus lingam JN3]
MSIFFWVASWYGYGTYGKGKFSLSTLYYNCYATDTASVPTEPNNQKVYTVWAQGTPYPIILPKRRGSAMA